MWPSMSVCQFLPAKSQATSCRARLLYFVPKLQLKRTCQNGLKTKSNQFFSETYFFYTNGGLVSLRPLLRLAPGLVVQICWENLARARKVSKVCFKFFVQIFIINIPNFLLIALQGVQEKCFKMCVTKPGSSLGSSEQVSQYFQNRLNHQQSSQRQSYIVGIDSLYGSRTSLFHLGATSLQSFQFGLESAV